MNKLTVLLYIYIAFYFLFSAWTIVSDVKDKEPWWDIIASAVLFPLGGIGIVLYVSGVMNPSIRWSWRAVSIIVVAGLFFANVVSRHLTVKGKTDLDSEAISQWTILAADLFVVVFLAPMFAMNLMFAFS